MQFYIVVLLFSVFVLSTVLGQNIPDTPYAGQRPANLLPFNTGSLIIDMGQYQTEDTTVLSALVPSRYTSLTSGTGCGYTIPNQYVNSSTAGFFNIWSYGFAIRLLYANVPVFWAIKSSKTDQTTYDISGVQAMRINPTRNPGNGINWGGSYNQVGTFSFMGGPLVIRAEDASDALATLSSLKSAFPGKGRFESLVIYKTTTTMTIDIRHKLNFTPFIFVSTLAGNWCTWSAIALLLLNIGLVEDTHFSLILQSNQLTAFNESTCGTMFMEPHFVFDKSSCSGCLSTPDYIGPLTKFIQSGGNFWVQCAGVTSYENSLWPSQYYPPNSTQAQEGAFLSKYGMNGYGNNWGISSGVVINAWQGGINVPNLVYTNFDLPVAQFIGNVQNQSGTITSWTLRDDPAPGAPDSQLFANNGFGFILQPLMDPNTWKYYTDNTYPSGPGGKNNTGPCLYCCPWKGGSNAVCNFNNQPTTTKQSYVATGARLSNANTYLGGNVWYYGTHSHFFDWTQDVANNTYPSGYVETPQLYAGRRVLLNSLLVPAVRPPACKLNFCSLDLDCVSQYGNCWYCDNSTNRCVDRNPGNCATGYNRNTCACNSVSPSMTASTSKTSSTSASRTPSSSVTPSSSISVSRSASVSVTPTASRSATQSVTLTPSMTGTATISHSAGASPSASNTMTPSTTNTASASPSTTKTASPSSSVTPSSTISLTPSASHSSGASSSNTPSVTPSSSISVSRSASVSVSASVSLSAPASQSTSPSSSSSSSQSSSNSQSASASPSSSSSPSPGVVAAGGGGGSNTGTIVGAVVGSVAGVAALAGLAAAGAAAAAIAYRKAKGVPIDTGNMASSDPMSSCKQSDLYVNKMGEHHNPLYAH